MNDELDRIAALVEDSRFWRAIARPLTVAPAAWQSSLMGRVFHVGAARWSSWPRSQRVRFIALTIGFAAAVHVLMLQVVPQYARPGIPLWWLVLVVAVAMFAGVCAEAITAAWSGSSAGMLIARIAAQFRTENRS